MREYQFFFERLITARKEAGLSQREAAERLGVPHSWIAQRETGETRADIVELAHLAALYGKPIEYFAPVVKH